MCRICDSLDHELAQDRARVERELLAVNAEHARENRAWLARREVVALNMVGAPGAGKTSLLEATIRALGDKMVISVLDGDQETQIDSARIRATGTRAVEINTGTGCHLDAQVVGHALAALDPPKKSLVFIENVGNLVCPALFDLGERAKVVVLATTEGEDTPLKYPHMFRASRALVLNKTDLLPHLRFDTKRCLDHVHAINPELRIFEVSAQTGEGLDRWCAWVEGQVARAKASEPLSQQVLHR